MSHVDDGMLHGYLDGGLSALDAVRVERHVADCAACRQRLDAARALIQRAARLLEWASPPAERAAPPLADLRPAAAPRWRVPAAWAATIVIALGAGLYGGQILLRPPRPAAAPAERDRATAPPRAEPLTALAEPESPAPAAAPAAPAPSPTTDAVRDAAVRRELAAQAPVPTAARETTVALNRVMPTGLAAAAPARDSGVPAGAATPRVDSAARQAGERQDVAAKAAPFAAPVGDTAARDERRLVTGRAAEGPSRPAESAASVASPAISADSARALLGTPPVTIPDLPVMALRAANGGVAVEQVVPPGRLIRLVQRRAAADEEQTRAAEPLARYVSGLRVEISGLMAPDSLARLLERARAP